MLKFRKAKKGDEKMLNQFSDRFPLDEGSARNKKFPSASIVLTLKEFNKFPQKGCVYVFEKDKKLAGYAIVINYWCNMYGGNIMAIDELFVEKSHRRKGIGRKFIEYLEKISKKNSIAISLEVYPENFRASKFYKKSGFKSEGYEFFIKWL